MARCSVCLKREEPLRVDLQTEAHLGQTVFGCKATLPSSFFSLFLGWAVL